MTAAHYKCVTFAVTLAASASACTLHFDPPEIIPECGKACIVNKNAPNGSCYCRVSDDAGADR